MNVVDELGYYGSDGILVKYWYWPVIKRDNEYFDGMSKTTMNDTKKTIGS